jgi:hypothetical protein
VWADADGVVCSEVIVRVDAAGSGRTHFWVMEVPALRRRPAIPPLPPIVPVNS